MCVLNELREFIVVKWHRFCSLLIFGVRNVCNVEVTFLDKLNEDHYLQYSSNLQSEQECNKQFCPLMQ